MSYRIRRKFDRQAVLTKVISWVKPWRLRSYDGLALHQTMPYSPIFLIGVPRSGTTVVYQVLSNYLNVLYPDNITHLYAGCLPFGMEQSVRRFGHRPHNVYESHHGKTWTFGWHAPSEFTAWFRRFFSDGASHYLSADVPKQDYLPFLQEMDATMRAYDKPLLFKNLGLSQKIEALSRWMPDAKFIYIRRDPGEVIDSIDRMRTTLQIAHDEWWSIKPHNVQELAHLPYHERMVRQVHALKCETEKQLSRVDESRWISVAYSDFLNSFDAEFERIRQFTGLGQREGEITPFVSRERRSAGKALDPRFTEVMEKLSWE